MSFGQMKMATVVTLQHKQYWREASYRVEMQDCAKLIEKVWWIVKLKVCVMVSFNKFYP
jgi:hypothetical protein